ncbi:MAG: DUF1579 family protein [Candidatus Zhuqueibacterota bacterium]
MKLKRFFIITAIIGVLTASFTSASSQEKVDPATQQEMMAEYMKLAVPGPEHALFGPLVGTWNMDIKVWMQPGAEPMVFSGTSENKMVLGDRFLEMDSKSGEGDMYTETYSLFGFDRRHKKYVAVMLDTWGTYFVTAFGGFNEATKTLSLSGEDDDPIMKRMQEFDFNFTIQSPDKFVYESIFKNFPMPEGIQKEYKMLEITYTRK